MRVEILSQKQSDIFPYLKAFKKDFYLVGGTAIALHIGHRRSIDFDLFSEKILNKAYIRKKLKEIPGHQVKLFEDTDQLHLLIDEVKVTFFHFPYKIEHPQEIGEIASMPTLLTLASIKAFALGRRAKWKDYVDLFFILRDHYSVEDICIEGQRNFGEMFSDRLFRQQLSFHKDIDYSEEVEFTGPASDPAGIREFLVRRSISL